MAIGSERVGVVDVSAAEALIRIHPRKFQFSIINVF